MSIDFGTTPATGGGDAPSYLTLATAAELLATLPSTQLAAYRAASDADKVAGLAQATADIDQLPFQGQRYDLSGAQVLEFPRLPYPTARQLVTDLQAGNAQGVYSMPGGALNVRGGIVTIWAWDSATNSAVVPRDVKLAVLHQADSILDGTRSERLDARHDGLASQSVMGLSESYTTGRPDAAGQLCRSALNLLAKYRLKGGSLL